MKIKKMVLAVAIFGSFGLAHATDTKSPVVEPKPQTKLKCPNMVKPMPMPVEHRVKIGGCDMKKPAVSENYNRKIDAELVGKNNAPALVEGVPPQVIKHGPMHPKVDSKIIAVEDYKVVKANSSVPPIDVAQEKYDAYYNNASLRLREIYNPARYGQYALPTDIATMKVGRVKSGVLSNFDMFGKKDKLSIYLFQHKPAMRLYGLYEQRMIAWHKGRAPMGVTVESAINQEAKHLFLDTALVSNETTLDMMKYLDARLSSKDSDILRVWLIKHKDHAEKDTVLEIIAKGVAQQKIDSLYLR